MEINRFFEQQLLRYKYNFIRKKHGIISRKSDGLWI